VILFSVLLSGLDRPASAQAPSGDYLASLLTEARTRKLSEHRYWHLLLHYRHQWTGRVVSEADGKDFFLAPNGKYRPDAELEATITAFFAPFPDDPEAQHPQCRFPARFAWLKQALHLDPQRLPVAPCERFETWRSRLDPESATIIFADAYLANPPSMYGHTFVRLNHKAHRREERLLDYTINFSADTETRNGIMFAILGLIGGYPGRFSTTPYYIKVQEYTNLESRDLWEYQLSLSPQQLDRLVMHLWELGSTYFDYFFLTQNCSYQLLPLIEIADPERHLSESARPWVIPIDTIRTLLKQPGLVTGVERRPSHMNQMLEQRSRLTADEIDVAEAVSKRMDLQAKTELDRYPDQRKALILDTAYDYFRYREGFTHGQSAENKKLERRILLERTRLGLQASEPGEAVQGIPPHNGHKSGLASLRVGVTRHSSFEELAIRPALHDLAADQTGYLPNSQLEMFHLRLRYDNEDRKPYLEELTFLRIVSLSPTDRWIRKPSWKVVSGLDLAKELDCVPRRCLYYGFNVGRGISAKTDIVGEEVFYLLAEADLGGGKVFRDGYRIGGGVRMGLLMSITPVWRAQMEGAFLRYPLGDIHTNTDILIDQAFQLTHDLDLRLTFQQETSYREATVALRVYF